ELADVDLGPSPPPGSSRLFARSDVVALLRSQGITRAFAMPSTVRVQSASRRFSSTELAELVGPRVRSSLPPGATIKDLRVSRAVLASPRIEVGDVRIPRLVRRTGELTITANAD